MWYDVCLVFNCYNVIFWLLGYNLVIGVKYFILDVCDFFKKNVKLWVVVVRLEF